MEQPQNQLVYWDKHRIPVNITLFFALAVTAFGIVSGPAWILIVAGIGVAAYSWFSNPRRYMIYQDALTLVYGTPRVRVIHFANISRLEMRTLATPDRLRVWLTNGRRVVLMARDPDAFHEQLQQAIHEFARHNPEYGILTEGEEPPTPSPEQPAGEFARDNPSHDILPEAEEPPTPSPEQPANEFARDNPAHDILPEAEEPPTPSPDRPANEFARDNPSHDILPEAEEPPTPSAERPAEDQGSSPTNRPPDFT